MLDNEKLNMKTAELIETLSAAIFKAKTLAMNTNQKEVASEAVALSEAFGSIEVKYRPTVQGMVLATVSIDDFEPFFFHGTYDTVRLEVLKSLLSYVRRATNAYEDELALIIGDIALQLIKMIFEAEADKVSMTACGLKRAEKLFEHPELKIKASKLVNRVTELMYVNKILKLAAFALGRKTLNNAESLYHVMKGNLSDVWLYLSTVENKGGLHVALNTEGKMVPVIHFGLDGKMSFVGEVDRDAAKITVAIL